MMALDEGTSPKDVTRGHGVRKDVHCSQSSAAPPFRSSLQQTVSGVSHAGIGCRPWTIVAVKGAMRSREERIVGRGDPLDGVTVTIDHERERR